MESFLRIKRLPRRFALGFYSCCLSLFVFCAFYTYSINQTKLNRPIEDVSITDNLAIDEIKKKLVGVESKNIQSKNPSHQKTSRISKKSYDLIQASLNIGHVQSLSNVESLGWDNNDEEETFSFPPIKLGKNTFIPNHHVVSTNDKVLPNAVISNRKVDDNQNVKDSVDGSPNAPILKNKDNQVNQLATATSNSMINDTSCDNAKAKLILLWTPFFDIWEYMTSSSFERCKGCKNCLVTTNRSMLLESDAVIFHARDMSVIDVPAVRLPQQRWIFYCLESPPYSDFPGLQFMHRMFNWTMTYRLDSDIVTDYGSVKKVHPQRKLDKSVLREVWRRKSRSVVWMSSHCPTHGGRDDYADQLKKYIDVDIYGSCGQLDCSKDSTEHCLTQFSMTYKFFLAFENSICKDYVTEKFFRTLSYDIVPVVFGGASYRKVAPPGSYIDALSFKSPKHLAFFLAGVGKDFHLYSTYFEWRKDFAVRLNNQRDCTLCSLLHDRNINKKIYGDLRKWWVQEGQCRVWERKQ